MRRKSILARKLQDKLANIRAEERQKVYQLHLFAPDAKPEISFEAGFEFCEGMHDDVPKYRATVYSFNKHVSIASIRAKFAGSAPLARGTLPYDYQHD